LAKKVCPRLLLILISKFLKIREILKLPYRINPAKPWGMVNKVPAKQGNFMSPLRGLFPSLPVAPDYNNTTSSRF